MKENPSVQTLINPGITMSPIVNLFDNPHQTPNQKKTACNNSTNLTLTIQLQPYLRVDHIYLSSSSWCRYGWRRGHPHPHPLQHPYPAMTAANTTYGTTAVASTTEAACTYAELDQPYQLSRQLPGLRRPPHRFHCRHIYASQLPKQHFT